MSSTIYHLQYKKENPHKLSQICSCAIFSKGFKNKFETTVVNQPSVFEPLKFYCIRFHCVIQAKIVEVIVIFQHNNFKVVICGKYINLNKITKI